MRLTELWECEARQKMLDGNFLLSTTSYTVNSAIIQDFVGEKTR